MSSPATLVRQRVKSVVATEFAGEGWTAADDKLLRAAGKDGTQLAVSPDSEHEDPRAVACLLIDVLFQLHLAYEAEPDEDIAVDPTIIEGYGDRLRRAFRTQSSGTTSDLWYLRVTDIDYPDDPTGNKTRLHATIQGRADNPAALPA